MIPPSIYRAVASIHDAQTDRLLGTGFLVSEDGLVLTANHVLAGTAGWRVRFPSSSSLDAVVVERGATNDWALLRLAILPVGTAPVPLAALAPMPGSVHWSTVGYAGIRGHHGGGLHGEVRVDKDGTELDLYCAELDGASYDDARGLSGGPCIVDGAAVAVITHVVYRNDGVAAAGGAIVAGHVAALPLSALMTETNHLRGSAGTPLPWEDVFVADLELLMPTARKIAAEKLGLVGATALPREIARRMLHRGVETVAEVLVSVRTAALDVEALVRLAASLWIDGLAADHLMRRIVGRQPTQLATDKGWSADQHLDRAYACCESGLRSWECFHVDGGHREPFPDHVVDEIGAALCEACGVDDVAVAKEIADDARPRVAFVRSQPRQDVIDRVLAEYPSVRVVFLSRALPSSGTVGVEAVAPAPSERAEHLATVARARAQGILRLQGGKR